MPIDDASLPLGAYELPVTRRVLERLEIAQARNERIHAAREYAGAAHRDRFANAISELISDHLAQKLLRTNSPQERIDLINALAHLIDADDAVDSEEILHAVYEASLADPPKLSPTPLSGASLLTNASTDLSMSAEIKREILTADSVDLLCAFVRNAGISVIRKPLQHLRDHGIPLRVITSTYCGGTQVEAIDTLVDEFGAEVKVAYETSDTRLHAKAWLFRRNSGFDTAYIGSSNLSNSALIDGIEWNVRTSRSTTPEVLDKFEAVFDTYWNDPLFHTYTPSVDRGRLTSALSLERAGGGSDVRIELSGLDVEPRPYQQAMLEALRAEREVHGRHRNLIIAATGTGKTVVAALDYKGLAKASQSQPPLLFVAHRHHLLTQAMRTYREVLKDPNFGDLYDGTNKPQSSQHIFATVQTLHQHLDEFTPDQFDVVVIDEFHHAEAKTYKKILDYFTPKELLGLTATPERGDGVNIQRFFDYRVAFELRLWDALKLGLVAPMHYYGINDETDLSGLKWSRSSRAYDQKSLTEFYVKQGDSRVKLILNELQQRVLDLSELTALGFCVSIDHARFMADRFTRFGIPSQAVTSQTPPTERNHAIQRLKDGELQVLFTVDLFNEGVDIPELNTLLLLRPTESPIIFLQQLGRGLRKLPGKVCTVLDFIGEQHEEFNFEPRYSGLTGKRGKRLVKATEDGFPSLPAGTHIELDRVTQERVLRNIQKATRNNIARYRTLVQQEATTDLSRFLANTGLELEDLYRNKKDGGWTRLLRSQNLIPTPVGPPTVEDFLLGRIRSMLHVNDPLRAARYLAVVDASGDAYSDMSRTDRTFTRMLVTQIWANQSGINPPAEYDEALGILRSSPSFASELSQVFSHRIDHSKITPEPVSGPGKDVLFTHADYSTAELTAALRSAPLPKLLNLPREGVYHVKEADVDLFFVTLLKQESDFSESTRYADFPISRDLFQWESQSTTKLTSKDGQRYIHHEENGHSIYLCVRNTRLNAAGVAAAFTLLGSVSHVSHSGEKPIRFEWQLSRPMPAQLYEQGRAAV
ncbi:DUF3427 domain-containing protein [Corynebacterium haemomassiliense]|uniref:DUF3427 domain-containing protein n=1 Tax=Corynebacterium haemomassiliense TaxID=2754726 RepID=UPI002889EB5B|nr:DUF3427 domain-containing protein [Corynebacterium haemomassiliense]